VIVISRRRLTVAIETVYFADKAQTGLLGRPDLIGYMQCAHPLQGLEPIRTLHTDLTQNAGQLFSGLGSSTRNQVNRAMRDQLLVAMITRPANHDLLAFQSFYNAFALVKDTTPCGDYHIETMRLLGAAQGLVITHVSDRNGLPFCYHVYVVDQVRAMLLYSGSHFRSLKDAEQRRCNARANRLLHWKDMLAFKALGFAIYDCGGLTADPQIEHFKRGFGGRDVTEYSGYVAVTWKGALARRYRS
jgi:hypothetical protein